MKFVAITACPTGIAHSQMAAENLETTAKERGHEIHVEVQGAMGTENEIPQETLDAADAVIIAADTSVQRSRFEDHIVVKGSVKDGVNDADGLIDEAEERVEEAGGPSESTDEADTTETTDATETADATESTAPAETESPRTADKSSEPESANGSDSGFFARLKQLFS